MKFKFKVNPKIKKFIKNVTPVLQTEKMEHRCSKKEEYVKPVGIALSPKTLKSRNEMRDEIDDEYYTTTTTTANGKGRAVYDIQGRVKRYEDILNRNYNRLDELSHRTNSIESQIHKFGAIIIPAIILLMLIGMFMYFSMSVL